MKIANPIKVVKSVVTVSANVVGTKIDQHKSFKVAKRQLKEDMITEGKIIRNRSQEGE